ncbi:hypothetical protein NIES2107_04610 [Nostoc carneum NIES-2107]|nr:hypothetical protein NIES2107_04610 [Nostoc carneum NIES-2107]
MFEMFQDWIYNELDDMAIAYSEKLIEKFQRDYKPLIDGSDLSDEEKQQLTSEFRHLLHQLFIEDFDRIFADMKKDLPGDKATLSYTGQKFEKMVRIKNREQFCGSPVKICSLYLTKKLCVPI